MHVGYARVALSDQNPAAQLDALLGAGCKRVFKDEGLGGAAKRRPQLDQALASLRSGDVLVVWRLDRLAWSLTRLIELTNELVAKGIGFQSLSESIDTTGEEGARVRQMLQALSDFERSLVVERTRAGLLDAKRRGARLGRKPKLSEDQISHAKQLIDTGESPSRVAKTLGVSTATLYRAIPAGASNRNTPDLFAEAAE